MVVAVCVITRERPVGLARVLESVGGQHLAGGDTLVVCVVDNDPRGGSRDVVDSFAAEDGVSGWMEVRYAVEPEPGIPRARNRAIELAAGADAVAFIDDDETATAGWLAALIDRQRETGADVVTGPAPPLFAEGVLGKSGDWMEAGGFFELPSHADGAVLHQAYTNNALVMRGLLDRQTPFFDEAVGHAGGSDTLAFGRAAREGATIVWCEQAVTREWIPASRANATWIVRRGLRVGNTRALVDRRQSPGAGTAARLLANGVYRLVKGTAEAVLGCSSAVHRVRGRRHIAYGVGMLLGIVGWRYQVYRTVHGH